MPPSLALVLTAAFVVALFIRDVRERPKITTALWLPCIWMLIIGTRFVSEWLNLSGPTSSIGLQEGNPTDRAVFALLIGAGFWVLKRRQVQLAQVVRSNVWLSLFLLYCLLAVTWSDFPFVAFKRWLKVLGHPVMALIVLTEPDPREALRRLMKRCAYVIVPVSILFLKYFPELGRGFDKWTGAAVNIGITTNKNALGYACMVLGIFFVWQLGSTLRAGATASRRTEIVLNVGFLGMLAWLMSMADSKTSLMCLLAGIAMMWVVGWRVVGKKYLGIYVIVGVVVAAVTESLFGVYEAVIMALGRDVSLTDRTDIWAAVLAVKINPVIGAGFESFWLGERLESLWQMFWFQPNQAHNGYIETYLNLGLIGVSLLGVLIVATFLKGKEALLTDSGLGSLRIGLLSAIVLFNYTEATFKALHLVWFAFYLIALDYPVKQALPTRGAVAPLSAAVRGRARVAAAGRAATGPPGRAVAARPPVAVARPPRWVGGAVVKGQGVRS